VNTPFLIVLLILLSPLSHAGKLYKIINEDGSTSFSQFAPDSSNKNKIVEEKFVRTGGKTPLTMRGLTSFCGKLKLPRGNASRDGFYSDVGRSLNNWKSRLDSKAESLRSKRRNYAASTKRSGSYNGYGGTTSGYLEGNRQLTRDIADLRCAISWAEIKMQSSHEVSRNISGELNHLQDSLAKIESKALRKCGEEPRYRPDDEKYQSNYHNWSSCNRDFSGKVRGLKRRISVESRKLDYMQ